MKKKEEVTLADVLRNFRRYSDVSYNAENMLARKEDVVDAERKYRISRQRFELRMLRNPELLIEVITDKKFETQARNVKNPLDVGRSILDDFVQDTIAYKARKAISKSEKTA